MSHDEKTWEGFNQLDEANTLLSAMYATYAPQLKKRGPKFTPPKKKRKNKK